MKRHHVNCLILFLSSFLLFLGPVVGRAEAQAFKRVSESDQAPDFSLKVAGKEIRLSDYKGKVVGIVFWKNPSLRCAKELAILQDLYQKYNSAKGLEMIAVYVPRGDENVPPDEIADMEKVLSETGVTYPNLIDRGMKVFSTYGVITFPSYAIIKEDGRVGTILPGLPTFGGEKLIRRSTKRLLGIKEKKKVVIIRYKPKGKAAFYFNFAKKMYLKGFEKKALQKLERVLQEDPGYYRPYQLQGAILAGQKKVAEAIQAYQKAVELAPKMIKLKMELGQYYLDNGKRDEALELYKNILEENPDSPDGHYGLGTIFAREDKLEEALQELVMAKNLFQKQQPKEGDKRFNPNRGHVHHELGLIYTQQGDFEQAFVEFTQACEAYDKLVRDFSK